MSLGIAEPFPRTRALVHPKTKKRKVESLPLVILMSHFDKSERRNRRNRGKIGNTERSGEFGSV